jgi:hypothetical protein
MDWPIFAALGSLFRQSAIDDTARKAPSATAIANLGMSAPGAFGGQKGGLIVDNPLTDPTAALGGAPIPEKPSFLESLFSSSGEQVQLPSIDLGGIQAPHVDAASDLQKLLAFIAASRQKSGGHKRPPQIQTSKYMQSLMGG